MSTARSPEWSKSARAIAVAVGAVIGLTAVAPASAGPLPVTPSRAMDSPLTVENVQYRPHRGQARVQKRRGNNGAAAAAVIGAFALGAAAIAASNAEKRRQRRIEREYYYGAGYPYGYAQPAPRGYAPQYYQPAPQSYYHGGYYYQQPVQQWPRGQRVDRSSPYAVQQQRARQGYVDHRYQRQVVRPWRDSGEVMDHAPNNTPF